MDDVDAWATKNKVECSRVNRTETVRSCSDVPAASVGEPQSFGAIEEVVFQFHANRTLSNMTTLRRQLTIPQASTMANEMTARLKAVLGAPTVEAGETTAAHFAKSALSAYKVEYVFGDYGAEVSAVRIGDTGIMVREHFISANL